MSAREIIWRGTFGTTALLAFVMAWVSIWSPGDLLVAVAWAFVYAVGAFLALESEIRDI